MTGWDPGGNGKGQVAPWKVIWKSSPTTLALTVNKWFHPGEAVDSWGSGCQLLKGKMMKWKSDFYPHLVTRQNRVSSLDRGDKHVSAIAWIDMLHPNGPAHCWGSNGANHRLIMDLVLKTVSLILKVVSLSREMMIYKKSTPFQSPRSSDRPGCGRWTSWRSSPRKIPATLSAKVPKPKHFF